MIVASSLLGYALLLAVAGPRLLSRRGWAERAPRLGIIAWQSLTATVLVAVALAGLALVMPTVRVSADLANLLQACVMALRAQYATPGGAAAGATGAVLALAVVGRAGYCLIATLAVAVRGRSRHCAVLARVAAPAPQLGAVVLDEAAPAVYCLPGRRRRIVVTTGAMDRLDDHQLAAALAHERAHLSQRHHLVLAWAAGLARAFPRVRLFGQAQTESQRLVELLADDVAARSVDRLTLAEALLALASGMPRVPVTALGAGGSTAATRVRRLIEPPRRLGRLRAALASLVAAIVLAVPIIALASPAIAATHMNYCPTQPAAASSATA